MLLSCDLKDLISHATGAGTNQNSFTNLNVVKLGHRLVTQFDSHVVFM